MDEGIFCLLFCKTLPLDFHKIDCLNLCKILSLSTKQRFLNQSLKKSQKIQGRVFIQFVIDIDGSIEGIRTRGPHPLLEKEANRIISLLPKITPGSKNGKLVKVPFSIPITFKLQ